MARRRRRKTNNRFAVDIMQAWRPPPEFSIRDWVPKHIQIPDTTEDPGPFRLDIFPHVEEVLWQADDPVTELILLDWATRNAKTFTAIIILVALVANTGRPALFASSDELTVNDLRDEKLLPMLQQTPATAELLPKRQNLADGIQLGGALMRRAFAGSKGRLSGFPACYGLINEAGLWPMNSIHRAYQRGRNFPFDRLFIAEGKPETKGRSAITKLIQALTVQRRYRFAFCPKCRAFQRLIWGWGKPGAGVKWHKLKSGRTDPLKAIETAYYECANGCRLEDVHREDMMQLAHWVPEGRTIHTLRRGQKKPRITGKASVASCSRVAFTGLSTLYSLKISGWGQLAGEWLDCAGDSEARREFITGTLAEEFDPAPKAIKPHELAELFGSDMPLRLCPEWSRFVTLTADVGSQGDELIFYWLAMTWGGKGRGHVLDRGICWSREEFVNLCRNLVFPHEDGGRDLRPIVVGPDASSGFHANEIYELCSGIPHFWPLKASPQSNFPEWFRLIYQVQGEDPKRVKLKRTHKAGDLLEVNTERTQTWRENVVFGLIKENDPGRITIAAELCDDVDFLDQLLSDYKDEKGHWQRRGENEFGDAFRYDKALAEFYVSRLGGWHRLRPRPKDKPPKPTEPSRKRKASRRDTSLMGGWQPIR